MVDLITILIKNKNETFIQSERVTWFCVNLQEILFLNVLLLLCYIYICINPLDVLIEDPDKHLKKHFLQKHMLFFNK